MFKFKEESKKVAKMLNIKNNLAWLGEGDYGAVYEITGTDKALKVTTDLEEVISSFKLLNVHSDNFVNIHNLVKINDNEYGIIMDKIETKGVEELFDLLDMESKRQMVHYTEVDINNSYYNLPKETEKLMHRLKEAKLEAIDLGFDTNDIHMRNIGIKNNGDFVIFDQSKSFSKKEIVQELKTIDNYLEEKHNIEILLNNKNKEKNKSSLKLKF